MNGERQPRGGLRIGFVILTVGLFLVGFVYSLSGPGDNKPFEKWYGNWSAVITTTVIFLYFLFSLTRPRRPKEWRGAGLASAFFISLFTEMFGIPLTIYLLAPLLGLDPGIFGMRESHLLAYLLSQAGVVSLKAGVYIVMVLSTGLILLGFTFLAVGWKEVYRGEGILVTDGLYANMRHPQYLGLIVIVVAFLFMWPTLPTLLLGPILIVMYIRQARREDEELKAAFGQEFIEYANHVPAVFPFRRSSGQWVAIKPSEERKSWMVIILAAWMLAFAAVPAKAASQGVSVEETLSALGKGHVLGNANAPVTVVEFSDFQCSFCKKFWARTLPKIKETNIKNGKVRFIYRHFAILGKHSVRAAQGAECAGEQGKFWEYHDRLYANQGAFTGAKLRQYASELKLHVAAFGKCLDSAKYKEKVAGETAVAAFLGARGTPTFFVNGRLLVGAQPFEVFQTVIEEELRKRTSQRK